ncbi:ribosome maturation factor RimM [Castellaniella sp. GW247-6E4]|uniref:ribosome maturation factor RimM n=1 Tax=Castellaniella sp. GW247-6E4 TaxID=3140380 RepID=UPI00331609E9
MAGRASGTESAPDDLVEVGRVVGPHGVRGWLKVQPYSTDAQALLRAPSWWFKTPDSGLDTGVSSLARAIGVRASRLHGGRFVVAQLEGIADRDAAEGLQGCTVWASRAAFPETGADEYYWVDLIGCDFYGESGGMPCFLGRVDEVLDNGAHAVLRVARGTLEGQGGFQPALDARGRAVHTFVPFVQAHVHRVDLAARRMDSDWPDDF